MFIGCSRENYNCPEDYNDMWEFMGKNMVDIDTIIFPDIISFSDSLPLEIRGKTIRGDRFDNVDMDIERDSLSILISLYADIYDWVGCGPMPPTSLWPISDTVLLQPFNVGYLKLIANQSYGFDTIGRITVLP